MPFDCPACGKPNKDDARACAFCPEAFPDEDDIAQAKQRQRRRVDPASWPVTVWLAIFAVGVYGVWQGLMFFMTLGENGMKNPITRMVNRRTEVFAGDTIMAGQIQRSTAAMAGAGPGAEQGIPEGKWVLTGTVFDLVSLEPVKECGLVFHNKDGRYEAKTDGVGRYRVLVAAPEKGGYEVALHHEGYSKSYLNPGAENVPKMSAEDRQGLAHDLVKSGDGLYSVQAIEGEPLATDFYLAPEK